MKPILFRQQWSFCISSSSTIYKNQIFLFHYLKKFFHGVKIKPGQHILIATHKKTSQILIALPGFAYSSTVTAILYVLPLIRKMLDLNFENEIIEAFLAEKFYKKSKKTEFTAGNLYSKDGKNFFDFQGKIVGTSAILTNMLNSANLLMTSETDGDLEKGTKVNILKIC